jgi:exosortase
MNHHFSPSWLPVVGVVALWTPAMLAASYVWGHGEYYDYGWFVPPAAVWLILRRWQQIETPVVLPQTQGVLVCCLLLLPWILVLRVLGYADPSWRLPTSLLGLTACVTSHGLIALTRGRRASVGFGWITLLLVSALPWPTVLETGIVHHLTQWVVTAVAEIFQIMGKPVEVMGDRLRLHELTVEVTDGCSGVRSFQSFVMATWFFAELQRLRVSRAVTLLACACGVAFVVNVARTYALAQIRFEYGKEAFARAHDPLGLLAFVASGLFFYFLSGALSTKLRRTVVRSVQSSSNRTRLR